MFESRTITNNIMSQPILIFSVSHEKLNEVNG